MPARGSLPSPSACLSPRTEPHRKPKWRPPSRPWPCSARRPPLPRRRRRRRPPSPPRRRLAPPSLAAGWAPTARTSTWTSGEQGRWGEGAGPSRLPMGARALAALILRLWSPGHASGAAAAGDGGAGAAAPHRYPRLTLTAAVPAAVPPHSSTPPASHPPLTAGMALTGELCSYTICRLWRCQGRSAGGGSAGHAA